MATPYGRLTKIIITWILSVLLLFSAAISAQAGFEAVLPVTLSASSAASMEIKEIVTIVAESGTRDMEEGKSVTLILPPGDVTKTSYLHAELKRGTSSWIIGTQKQSYRATLMNDGHLTNIWIVEDLSTGMKTDQIQFHVAERKESVNTGDTSRNIWKSACFSLFSIAVFIGLLIFRCRHA